MLDDFNGLLNVTFLPTLSLNSSITERNIPSTSETFIIKAVNHGTKRMPGARRQSWSHPVLQLSAFLGSLCTKQRHQLTANVKLDK